MKFKLFAIVKSKTFIVTLLMCLGVGFAQAQKITVKGNVSGDGDVLPGASVLVKGQNKGSITDFDGNFEIEADNNSVLIFSFMGYSTIQVPVNGRKTIKVVLEAESNTLEEVVVVGYGQQKKKEVTGAVVKVKAAELEKTTTSDIGAALQGQIAGVSVTASSGEPGSESNILIRGFSSVLDGQNQPLYVVEGIPFDSDPQLSISEIESIDVLKDAASASIYGTRGANGVILITTKQGKVGMMNIRVNSEYGIQKINSSVPLMSKEEIVYHEQLFKSLSTNKVQGNVDSRIHTNASWLTNNTDISQVILNDLAPIQNHSINVSGGKEGLTYSFNANYFQQEGVLINSDYKRFNVRSNTVFTKDKWKVITGLTFKRDERVSPNYNLMTKIFEYRPYQQPIDLDATEAQGVIDPDEDQNLARNINGITRNLKTKENRDGNSHAGNMQIEYKASKALKFTVRSGATFSDTKQVRIIPKFDIYDTNGDLIPPNPWDISSNRTISTTYSKLTFEGMVNYNKKFGNHKINALFVYAAEKSTNERYSVEKRENIFTDITVLDGYNLMYDISSGFDYSRTLIGTLARLQYNYKGKYLLSASIRRDGSSQFAKENRWGWFPSVSAGWNVSDEFFWNPVKDVMNAFKIRASYGTTGNDRFQAYSNQAVVNPGLNYVFGSADSALGSSSPVSARGIAQEKYANAQVGWETSIESNIGYDMGFFKNRLTISTDIYKSKKNDLLFPVVNPPSTGVSGQNRSTTLNVGDMENSGVEYGVKFRNKGKSGLKWNVGVTYTRNQNRITKMSPNNPIVYLDNGYISQRGPKEIVTVLTEGYEAGAFFLRETDGLVTEADLDGSEGSYGTVVPTARVGDLKYVDQNGDGEIDQNDKIYKGSGTPDFEMGLNFGANFKNFDFSMQWFGSFGAEVMNGSKAYAYQSGTHKDLYYAHTIYNTSTQIPYNDFDRNNPNYRDGSEYFLEDGSYVRLRNVALGYSFNKNVLEKMGLSKFRIYIQAQNPLTFTNYSGFDPEVGNNGLSTRGIDRGTYPVSAQYKAGLQLQF